jgi:hypothetical protein
MKNVIVVKTNRAVRPFRKSLAKRVWLDNAKLRVFGSKGDWYLGVQVGRTIHRYSPSFTTQKTAIKAGYNEFGVKAVLYKVAA